MTVHEEVRAQGNICGSKVLALRSLKEEFSKEVALFFYYHKRMDTSHLEIVWPVNS
jgi:hypothetical protein